MLDERAFGEAGAAVVIEEFLPRRGSQLHRHGRRRGTFCRSRPRRTTRPATTVTRARTPAAWAPTRRHRLLRRQIERRIMREVMEPAVAGMAADGSPVYRVSLCRPDDRRDGATARCSNSTAASVIRRRSRSCCACVRSGRRLSSRHWMAGSIGRRPTGTRASRSASSWPLAATRSSYRKGDRHPRTVVSSAAEHPQGVSRRHPPRADGQVLTDGGRVLCVVALGESTSGRAGRRLTRWCKQIHWPTRSTARYRTSATVAGNGAGARAPTPDSQKQAPSSNGSLPATRSLSASSTQRNPRWSWCPASCPAGTRPQPARPSGAEPCAAPTSSAARRRSSAILPDVSRND